MWCVVYAGYTVVTGVFMCINVHSYTIEGYIYIYIT